MREDEKKKFSDPIVGRVCSRPGPQNLQTLFELLSTFTVKQVRGSALEEVLLGAQASQQRSPALQPY